MDGSSSDSNTIVMVDTSDANDANTNNAAQPSPELESKSASPFPALQHSDDESRFPIMGCAADKVNKILTTITDSINEIYDLAVDLGLKISRGLDGKSTSSPKSETYKFAGGVLTILEKFHTVIEELPVESCAETAYTLARIATEINEQ